MYSGVFHWQAGQHQHEVCGLCHASRVETGDVRHGFLAVGQVAVVMPSQNSKLHGVGFSFQQREPYCYNLLFHCGSDREFSLTEGVEAEIEVGSPVGLRYFVWCYDYANKSYPYVFF